MNRTKALYLFLLFLSYSIIVTSIWRPYVYSHKIFDFGIADIGNNIAFVPGVYLAVNLFNKRFMVSKYADIWISFCLLTFVEIASYYVPHIGTFDLKDILGLFIGSLLIYFIVKNDK